MDYAGISTPELVAEIRLQIAALNAQLDLLASDPINHNAFVAAELALTEIDQRMDEIWANQNPDEAEAIWGDE